MQESGWRGRSTGPVCNATAHSSTAAEWKQRPARSRICNARAFWSDVELCRRPGQHNVTISTVQGLLWTPEAYSDKEIPCPYITWQFQVHILILLTSISISFSHLCIGLPCGVLSCALSTVWCKFLVSPTCSTWLTHHIILDLITLDILNKYY